MEEPCEMVDCDEILQEYLLDNIEVSGRQLGVGSYSSVLELKYKGMKCAGKKIHPSLYEHGVSIGPEILGRFGNECELLSQLRHPHIVQFLGLHFEDECDVPILVLEYLPEALTDCIEHNGVLPDEISYSVLYDVAVGLHYLHDHRPPIIHRDLTANNVLLTSNMTAKVSDLGMAKILNLPPAQMARRMTVCPGTISYMPPEALIADPVYDTKLDCFSFGVLMLHVFCGEWPLALEYLQPDPKRPGHLVPLTELERREKFLKRLGHDHPLLGLIRSCLRNIASERPRTVEILSQLSQVSSRFPSSFDNRVEMLQRIKTDAEEKEGLRSEINQLKILLNEKKHEYETSCLQSRIGAESMSERITRLEQLCAVQEAQILELQTENNQYRLTLELQLDELDSLRLRADRLNRELDSANNLLREKAEESAKKLRQIQSDIVASSQERETALQGPAIVKTLNLHLSSIARSQLDVALRCSPPCRTCDDLSHDFEEFFLNNADDVAEVLKESQNTGDVNQFHSQQTVCEMVQQSYSHCKARVMEELKGMLEELFRVRDNHVIRSTEALHDARIAYGLLLRATQLRESQQYKAVSQQILRNLLGSECPQQSSLQNHVDQACKMAWELLTTSPPLIVTQPQTYREDWHDREFEYWDKNTRNVKLYYTRPVLFQSYDGRVGVKGWVGNRNTTVE